jgi:hypothetical protein
MEPITLSSTEMNFSNLFKSPEDQSCASKALWELCAIARKHEKCEAFNDSVTLDDWSWQLRQFKLKITARLNGITGVGHYHFKEHFTNSGPQVLISPCFHPDNKNSAMEQWIEKIRILESERKLNPSIIDVYGDALNVNGQNIHVFTRIILESSFYQLNASRTDVNLLGKISADVFHKDIRFYFDTDVLDAHPQNAELSGCRWQWLTDSSIRDSAITNSIIRDVEHCITL